MVCMVRLGDVETALEYADQQACDVTQLVQVLLRYLLLFLRLVVVRLPFICTETATVVTVTNVGEKNNYEKNTAL